MTMPGNGCFVAWYDLAPGHDAGHDHWHTHEHMIERVAIPGFLRGFRYHSLAGGGPSRCVIYHTDELATLGGPAYIERLNNPTAWSARTLPHFVGMNRTMCRVGSTHGAGFGGVLLTIRLSPRDGAARSLARWLDDDVLPALAARAGFAATHRLTGDRAASETPTREKELRGAPDAVADWVVLVEGYERTAVEHAKAELLGRDGLFAHGVADAPIAGVYALDFTLGEDEAKRIWRKP